MVSAAIAIFNPLFCENDKVAKLLLTWPDAGGAESVTLAPCPLFILFLIMYML